MLVINNGILYAQSTIPVDTSGIWYTNKQDLNCLRCLMSEEARKQETLLCYEEVESCRSDYAASVELNDIQRIENKTLTEQLVKVERQRNIVIGIGGCLAILCIIIGSK